MDELYEKLMERMDRFPLGAPRSPNLLELLKTIFLPEEAEAALRLPAAPVELEAFAAELGRPLDEVERLLEGMADHGLVFARERGGKKYYNLLPLLPGIFEMQFMKAETTPAKRRVAQLFDAYYHEAGARRPSPPAPPWPGCSRYRRRYPGATRSCPTSWSAAISRIP